MTHLSVGHILFLLSSLLWLVAFLAGRVSEQWPHLLWVQRVPVALLIFMSALTLVAAWAQTFGEIIQ